ncbi:hypothetical protein Tco_0972307 [Tanacetum coccineum]
MRRMVHPQSGTFHISLRSILTNPESIEVNISHRLNLKLETFTVPERHMWSESIGELPLIKILRQPRLDWEKVLNTRHYESTDSVPSGIAYPQDAVPLTYELSGIPRLVKRVEIALVLNETTGLEVDNRNRNENRSHITHESVVRTVIVEDGLQHLENR